VGASVALEAGFAAVLRVGILVTVVIVLINLVGTGIGVFAITTMEARKVPGVKTAVQALTDYSVNSSLGTTLSYFGYEFQVPWTGNYTLKGNLTLKVIAEGGLVAIKFASGQDLVFMIPGDQKGLLTELAQDKLLGVRNPKIFGDLLKRSPYDQFQAILNTTPASIHMFRNQADGVRGAILLTIKAIAVGPGLETGAFSFELRNKRGFQIGDPHKSKHVQLELFDSTGRQIEIFVGTKNSGIGWSQQDLNRIITTLRPAAGYLRSTELRK
jgi:hypothetical protein